MNKTYILEIPYEVRKALDNARSKVEERYDILATRSDIANIYIKAVLPLNVPCVDDMTYRRLLREVATTKIPKSNHKSEKVCLVIDNESMCLIEQTQRDMRELVDLDVTDDVILYCCLLSHESCIELGVREYIKRNASKEEAE